MSTVGLQAAEDRGDGPQAQGGRRDALAWVRALFLTALLCGVVALQEVALAEAGSQPLDVDRDASISQAEFVDGFARLFQAWNRDDSGQLTLEQLKSGIQKDLAPSAPEGGPGFRPGRR